MIILIIKEVLKIKENIIIIIIIIIRKNKEKTKKLALSFHLSWTYH